MWRDRIISFGNEVIAISLKYPMEVIMGIVSFCLFCIGIFTLDEVGLDDTYTALTLFAVLMCFVAFVANQIKGVAGRILYFGLAPVLLFVWSRYWKLIVDNYDVQIVTFIAVVLLLFWSVFCGDNRIFTQRTASKFRSLFYACVVAGLSISMFFAIDLSIRYIFDATMEVSKLEICMAVFILVIVQIYTFLHFDKSEPYIETYPKFIDTLLKYIVTPALLIYSLVFCVYILKILFQFSLPEGGVAIMTLVYFIVTLIFKIFDELSTDNPFKWFYRWYMVISIPAMLIFWWGVAHRIGEYGYTQPRVYLAVFGVVMTLIILMSIFKTTAKYRYFIYLLIIAISAVAFIPRFTAKDIEQRSLFARFDQAVVELGLLDESGQIVAEKFETARAEQQSAIYDLANYMEWRNGKGWDYVEKKYGYSFDSKPDLPIKFEDTNKEIQ